MFILLPNPIKKVKMLYFQKKYKNIKYLETYLSFFKAKSEYDHLH
jgi:hypothetical protein